jgi:predicted AAA+ superfamily ATPase
VEYQKLQLSTIGNGFPRERKPGLKSISTHALIISGIRRCGKSTLAQQIMETMQPDKILYLNFETPRLYGFSMNDFSRLDNIIAEKQASILFFDEIQDVEGWEIFIRQKLDEKFKVIITGSNARLLSYELGTKLTGRQITYELFPFSYSEYVSYNNLKPSLESFNEYSNLWRISRLFDNRDEDILTSLFDDILVKDIIVRHGIKDSLNIKRLSVYLFNNIGNRVTATKLKQAFSVSATSTIMSWFSFLESTYLIFFLLCTATQQKRNL